MVFFSFLFIFYDKNIFRYANTVAFHSDGNCIGVGTTDSVVKIWDIRVHRLLQHYQGMLAIRVGVVSTSLFSIL